MTDALVCTYATTDAHVGRFRNALISLWHGPITVEALRAADSTSVLLGNRYPGRVANLTVVDPGTPVAVGEARSYASDSWKRSSDRLVANAIVVSGEGFWAGAARSALTGMMMFARTRYPNRVFSGLPEALDWFLPHVEGEASVQSLTGIYEQLRARTRPDLLSSMPPPRA